MVASLAARIAADIACGRFAPGSHVAARQLAERFQVSRSPVNEALRLLAAGGLLIHHPNRGYRVVHAPERAVVSLDLEAPDALERIYFRIAEDRLDGKLPDSVTQAYLRERYGVTLTQLMELIARMEREGWLKRRPGYGLTFLPVLTTPETLVQTYRFRMVLEPASLLEPGYALNRSEAAECRRVEESMLAGAIETMTAHELYDRGVRFHECIVGSSGNPFFLDALRRINSVRRLLAYRSMVDRQRYYEQAKDHLVILDLLEAGRNEEASWALRLHLGRVIHNLEPIRALLEPKVEAEEAGVDAAE